MLKNIGHSHTERVLMAVAFGAFASTGYLLWYSDAFATVYERTVALVQMAPAWPAPLDQDAYNAKMLALAHYRAPEPLASLPVGESTTTIPNIPAPLPVSTATTSVSVP